MGILRGARISWFLEAGSDAQRPRAQLRSTSRWISLALRHHGLRISPYVDHWRPIVGSAEDVDNAMEVTDTAGVAVLADPEGCSYKLVFGSKF